MTGFFYVVSLGYRCRTTQRLRDHFGYTTAFPFDWWVTPIDGLTRFLQDWDADRLYHPDRLRVRRKLFQKSWIENAEYDIGLVHEFPRESWQLAFRRYLSQAPMAKQRTAHLMEKFTHLGKKDRPVLFVRNLSLEEEAGPSACAALRDAVLRRVGLKDAGFLLISSTGVGAEGWVPLKIDDPTKKPWSGDPEVWDAALSTLGYHLHRPGFPPPQPRLHAGAAPEPGLAALAPRLAG